MSEPSRLCADLRQTTIEALARETSDGRPLECMRVGSPLQSTVSIGAPSQAA